jgi:hypothetical protein
LTNEEGSVATVEPVDPFPGRGSTVLRIIAIVLGIGILIALAAPGPTDVRLLVAVALGANALFLAWVGNGLAAREPWARPVAILALWSLVVFGILDTLTALAQNRLNIPIGAILAAYALAAPAGPIVFPADGPERERAQRATAIGILLIAVPFVLGLLARGA